jgi:hypothetical protein
MIPFIIKISLAMFLANVLMRVIHPPEHLPL